MDHKKLKKMLIEHEGIKYAPYLCTAGKTTIGIGHNLDDKGISKAVVDLLYNEDVAEVEDRTDEQEEAFQAFCSHYLLSQYLIGSKDGREYYHCILVDADNIPEMMALMAARTPVVNGCWDIDGKPYSDGLGNHAYAFDLPLHLTH